MIRRLVSDPFGEMLTACSLEGLHCLTRDICMTAVDFWRRMISPMMPDTWSFTNQPSKKSRSIFSSRFIYAKVVNSVTTDVDLQTLTFAKACAVSRMLASLLASTMRSMLCGVIFPIGAEVFGKWREVSGVRMLEDWLGAEDNVTGLRLLNANESW